MEVKKSPDYALDIISNLLYFKTNFDFEEPALLSGDFARNRGLLFFPENEKSPDLRWLIEI